MQNNVFRAEVIQICPTKNNFGNKNMAYKMWVNSQVAELCTASSAYCTV